MYFFHLYGFAESAKEFGDIKTHDDILNFLTKRTSLTNMADTIIKRRKSDGYFKMLPKDLNEL